MFAVIKTGGKQYKVAAENEITVMSLEGEAGARVTFAEVLALFDGDTSHVGAPFVDGASVVGEIVEQTRGPKVIAFKKRRRKNSKRKRGHKQDLTIVKILQILTDGAQASDEPAAVAEPVVVPERAVESEPASAPLAEASEAEAPSEPSEAEAPAEASEAEAPVVASEVAVESEPAAAPLAEASEAEAPVEAHTALEPESAEHGE
jgi:large subunit ribosomal protein L21